MQSFTVRGGRNGSQVHVRWTDGVLSGDPPTVDLLDVEAEMVSVFPSERIMWGGQVDPQGALAANALADPESAWTLIVSVLDSVTSGEGDLPRAAQEFFQRSSGPTGRPG